MPTTTPAADRLAQEIRKFGPSLLPGAEAILASRWLPLKDLAAPVRAQRIVERLALPAVARYHDPEYKPPTLPDGSAPSPVRAALERHKDRLTGGDAAVDRLTKEWSIDLAGRPPAVIASEIVRRLEARENRALLIDPAELPRHELAIREVLSRRFSDVLDDRGLDAVGRQLGAQYGHRPTAEIVRAVAMHLRGPGAPSTITGKPLPPGDPRAMERDETGAPAATGGHRRGAGLDDHAPPAPAPAPATRPFGVGLGIEPTTRTTPVRRGSALS